MAQWCNIKDTKYGDRLIKQLGSRNAKEYAMGTETTKFQAWFGNGKTIKLENGEVVPFINPIMQIINGNGKPFNLLERFKFKSLDDVRKFFATNQTPGIHRWGSEDTFFISKDDNRFINMRLLEEIDRIYPGLIVKSAGKLVSTPKDYQASSVESNSAKPTWFFTIDQKYSFSTPAELFKKDDDLIVEAKSLGENVKGLYKSLFESNPEFALFEAAIQANSSDAERRGAIKVFGERIVEIAQQLYPNVKVGDTFEKYQKAELTREYTEVDTKTKTLLDKLSTRFNIPYKIINSPSASFSGKFGADGVTINAAKMTPDTPFHEFLHPFIIALEQQNPLLYENLVNQMYTSPDGIKTTGEIQRKYPELSEANQIHEALVTHLGNIAQQKYEAPKSLIDRFIKWLKSLFKKMNIDMAELSLNTTLSQIGDMIVDDVFVADLQEVVKNMGVIEREKRVDTELTYEAIFDRIRDKIAILNATIKNRKKGDGFKEDIEVLHNILQNQDEITSINNFVLNSISYIDAAHRRFESMRDSVKNASTLSKSDLAYNMGILNELQQLLNVYDTLDDVRSLYIREGAKSTDDLMAKLADAIAKKDLMVEDFKSFALTYVTEWLFPYLDPTNKLLEAEGNKEDVITKDQFREQLRVALHDISAAGMWLGTVINSRDPVSAAVGLALKDVIYQNHVQDLEVKHNLIQAYDKVKTSGLYKSKKSEEEFNIQFLREAEVWEKTGVDDQGEPTYGYVNYLAFHTEYLDDQFDKARREMYRTVGPRPSRADKKAHRDWSKKVAEWYAQNTTVRSDAKDIIAHKKATLSKRQFERWILANTKELDNDAYSSGYRHQQPHFAGKVYSVNMDRATFRIFDGELIAPANKYKNPEFAGMMKNEYYKSLYKSYKEANDKLGTFGLRYGIVPQVSKGKNLFTDLKWNKSVKENLKTLKQNAKSFLKAEYDENRGIQRQDDTEVKKIPLRFTTTLEREDLDLDLLQSVLKFSQMSNNYNSMSEIEGNVLILRTVLNGDFNLGIKGRTVAKTNSKGKQVFNSITKKVIPKMAATDKLNARLNEFINDVVYGDDEFKESVTILGQEVSINKLADKVALLTALQNMALNFTGGISNVIIGNFNNSIEAFGGRFYSKSDLAKAQKEYIIHIPELVGEVAGATKSILNDMAAHYDVPQGEFQDQYGNHISGGQVNKLMRTSSLFFLQRGGEHEIQLTGMMALMNATKLKDKQGKDTTLYDAWKKSGSFNNLKNEYEWTDEQDIAFRNRLHAITKNLQGVYNKFDKAMLSRRWYGKLAIMFRKYMFKAFQSRYGTRYIDYEMGAANEGYWNLFAKKLYSEVKDYKFGMIQRMWTKEGYSNEEKAAVNKTLYELSVILAAFLLAGMSDDDDDKSWIDNQVALQLTRMSADITQYLNPADFIRVIRNPAASINMIEKWIGWFGQLTSPFEEYERASGIAKKGDNKLWIKTLKLMPVIRQVINFMTPEEQIKFYQMTGR